MTKRKVKEEIKKPDIVLRTITFLIEWAKTNTKVCIIGLIVVLVLCFSLFGYSVYSKKQNDKVQFMLSQAISTFGESMASNSTEKLNVAETLFNSILNENNKKINVIAKLYLARIHYIKGKTEEAKKLYNEVVNQTDDTVIKSIVAQTLKQIEK